MSNAMELRAERRRAAANRAREIAAAYTPRDCCKRCQTPMAIREDFAILARELKDENGMSDTDLWIAYREHVRKLRAIGEDNE